MLRNQTTRYAETLRAVIGEIRQLAECLEDNTEAYVLARRGAALLEACLEAVEPRPGDMDANEQ